MNKMSLKKRIALIDAAENDFLRGLLQLKALGLISEEAMDQLAGQLGKAIADNAK